MLHSRILSLAFLPLLASAAEYQLCFLEDGPNAGKFEKPRAEQLQAEHMKHIGSMWTAGALESAGPVGGFKGRRGIFLFSASESEATRMGSLDPKVQAGDLKLSCSQWTGPSNVGKQYRAEYGKPGFKDQMKRRTAILFRTVPSTPHTGTIVSGPLNHPEFKHFAVLETEDAKTIQITYPDAAVFLWFHDTQVWNGVN